jgi:hypothetical protein
MSTPEVRANRAEAAVAVVAAPVVVVAPARPLQELPQLQQQLLLPATKKNKRSRKIGLRIVFGHSFRTPHTAKDLLQFTGHDHTGDVRYFFARNQMQTASKSFRKI